MGKLIVVVGNTGVGKTTLVQALQRQGNFSAALEQHAERPFQRLFSQDLPRYALPNQVDYLLLRAEQEWAIRQGRGPGLQDGGLDLDFFVFTRQFFEKGYLTPAEFGLCRRFFELTRQLLPRPDLIIWLAAPLEVIARRFARRGRALEIAGLQDLRELQTLLEDWLSQVPEKRLVQVDASREDPDYAEAVPSLLKRIEVI